MGSVVDYFMKMMPAMQENCPALQALSESGYTQGAIDEIMNEHNDHVDIDGITDWTDWSSEGFSYWKPIFKMKLAEAIRNHDAVCAEINKMCDSMVEKALSEHDPELAKAHDKSRQQMIERLTIALKKNQRMTDLFKSGMNDEDLSHAISDVNKQYVAGMFQDAGVDVVDGQYRTEHVGSFFCISYCT